MFFIPFSTQPLDIECT